jgi:hypothetical protein
MFTPGNVVYQRQQHAAWQQRHWHQQYYPVTVNLMELISVVQPNKSTVTVTFPDGTTRVLIYERIRKLTGQSSKPQNKWTEYSYLLKVLQEM